MYDTDQSYKLNYIGEFQDPKLEKEYLHADMEKSLKVLKGIIIFLEVLNTLFLIPEFMMLHLNSFQWIMGSKILFFAIVMVFIIRMDKIKSPRVLTYCITSLELYACIINVIGISQMKNPNFLLQALSIAVVIIAVFMVPNRWIHMFLVALFNFISFILITARSMREIPSEEVIVGLLYLLVVVVFCSMMSYSIHYMKRVNYASNLKLIKISTTDYLTKIYNRGKLENELENEIKTARFYQSPLSIILFDFDNFKLVNDNFGHLDGDRLIVEVTALVRDSIREEDIFARWGGDEFVLLLPNKGKDSGVALAERIRDRIAANDFNLEVDVNCSFGVAGLMQEDDSKSLLDRADRMLYLAKDLGGNCVQA